ncbi:tetratricopeptide repeat protein [Silvibacterium acidisoli]|uniref:tetratricopeptide repeat protein n=1 Tax=Acidobacteriaceae bacterium ZG23-2 TaxID=2883246 RepID=UPI00406CFC8F
MRRLGFVLLLIGSSLGVAQQPAASTLTAEQQALFDAARNDFSEHHPELALEKMKRLHAMIPENPTITHGAAETAVVVGDRDYAISLLKERTTSDPDDTFALEWLARAYAESGNGAERDKTIAAVLKLHETSSDEQFRRADRFLVERVKLANGYLDIYYALVPFSPYHVYMLGRQVDAGNALLQQITLESNDGDQPGFAKQHPDMAAKGMRRFSMDTYSADRTNPDGTITQTQGLVGFIDGQPSYDDTKARMLKVANGATPPLASRSGLPVPKSN